MAGRVRRSYEHLQITFMKAEFRKKKQQQANLKTVFTKAREKVNLKCYNLKR